MLGPLEIRLDDGAHADVPGGRLRGLLVALALNPGHVVPKATLVDWIWGEHPPADAANALQRLASRLRKVLPEGSVEGQPDGYRLLVESDAVDAVRFERLIGQVRDDDDPQRVEWLREALALWRGTAMQDVGLADSSALDAAVTRLERLRLTAMEDRFDAEIGLGRGADLVSELTDLVAANPLRERLVAALMRALAASGRDSEALQVYQRTREALVDELGVDPSPELSALHVALLRGESQRREEESRNTNLREELTSYIGKDDDVAAVGALVAEHRLTTLIGPGGSGKTRLATETGRRLLGDFPDGAWLVELAAIGPEGDVAQAAYSALGLRDALLGDGSSQEPTDRLIAAMREREALLILDNCEHVIDTAATFAHRVLGECRNLRILATSREPLGIIGEALWPVLPLALPAEDADPAAIEAAPAVRLLRDRASAVRKDFTVDAGTLSTMVRICRALDGMPLAIELAAARLRTMTIDQLAKRLDDRFRLLTGGSRTALPRHRTLRAMVDWSWELLTDAERTVLRRLSVFMGGASLEAAERVCVGDAVEQYEVLELLTSLTEKSLLVADGGDNPRYRMLGTIKEYAELRLAEAEETELARRAHLAYFTELSETAEPHLRRAEQLDRLAELRPEHDNIHAAMRNALADGDAEAAMRLAAGAGWYWWLVGNKAEGLELITAALETPGEVDDQLRAVVYAIVVMFVTSGPGDEHQAAEWVHKAAKFARHAEGGHPGLGLVVAMERLLSGPDAVLTAFESALSDGDPWVRALARLQMGKMRVMLGRELDRADEYLATSLAEFRAIGERFGIAFALTERADLLAARGELAEACDLYEEGIAVVGELGAVDDVIRQRARLCQMYWALDDREAAIATLAEAERLAVGVTWPGTLAVMALAKAELARWGGDPAEAGRQLDVVQAVLGEDAEAANIRAMTENVRGYLAVDLGEARAHRAAAFAAASEAGHAPTLAHALVGTADLALRLDRPEQAARLLGAGASVRGLPDLSSPDRRRVEEETRDRLGEEEFAEAVRDGAGADWSELAAVTLAS